MNYEYELKFHDIPNLSTILRSQTKPQIGAIINADQIPTQIGDSLVIYGLNHKDLIAVAGNRYLGMPSHPLLIVDVALKLVRCNRCEKVHLWEVAPIIDAEIELLDETTILYGALVLAKEHDDCTYPICLN